MRKIFIGILTVIISISSIQCSKSSGATQSSQEPPILFTIDASNASVSTSSSFNVNVILNSAMPSSLGIKIELIVIDQTNSVSIIQNPPLVSNTAKNSFTLINMPQQHWCLATIKVSSVATPTNTSSQSFTVVYK